MKNNSIKNITFSGKTISVELQSSYNKMLSIKNNYKYQYINEEAFEFAYIGGADLNLNITKYINYIFYYLMFNYYQELCLNLQFEFSMRCTMKT